MADVQQGNTFRDPVTGKLVYSSAAPIDDRLYNQYANYLTARQNGGQYIDHYAANVLGMTPQQEQDAFLKWSTAGLNANPNNPDYDMSKFETRAAQSPIADINGNSLLTPGAATNPANPNTTTLSRILSRSRTNYANPAPTTQLPTTVNQPGSVGNRGIVPPISGPEPYIPRPSRNSAYMARYQRPISLMSALRNRR